MKSNRRLFLDAARREIVDEGDARAAFLLVGRDCEISEEDLSPLGIDPADLADAIARPGPAAPAAKAVPPHPGMPAAPAPTPAVKAAAPAPAPAVKPK